MAGPGHASTNVQHADPFVQLTSIELQAILSFSDRLANQDRPATVFRKGSVIHQIVFLLFKTRNVKLLLSVMIEARSRFYLFDPQN